MSLLTSFTGNTKNPPSLRSRYFSLTLLLGFIIVSALLFILNDIISTKQQLTNRLSGIHKQLSRLESIHDNQLNFYRHIDLFLLDPSQGNHATQTHDLIDNSIEISIQLIDFFQNKDLRLTRDIESLVEKLSLLRANLFDLTESRMDITRQYPAMAISAQQMAIPSQAIGTNIRILIDEIEDEELTPESEKLYPLLLKTNTVAVSLTSQVRIYLANRLASFSKDLLVSQAISVYEFHQQFITNINQLTTLYKNEDSFEATTLLKNLKVDSLEWIALFEEVRKISESDSWRKDSYLMINKIIPLTDKISASIHNLESLLLLKEGGENELLRKNNDTLTLLLIFIIALFLFFISTLILSLDRMVFKPVSSVAEALKYKAFNKVSPLLLTAKSKEVGDLIEAFNEMDNQVNRRQNELEHQALHDYLTGLPNRFMLTQHIEYQLKNNNRTKRVFSLLLMDLDNFKDINDSLGHTTGDMLLVKVAQRLTERMRKSDTVSRFGGDEFVILLPETTLDSSYELAKIINKSFEEPFLISEHTITIGMSIGIVSYPDDGEDVLTLLQHADIAMYNSKQNHTQFSHYEDSQDFYNLNRLALINDLRNAIDNDVLALYYQAQFKSDGKTLTGAEALLRWDHNQHGFINPEKIIELAEYANIIHLLSIWIIRQAVEQCARWHHMGKKVTISINLSVRDLSNPTLCEQISQILKQYQLPSEYLILEITENGMMENPANSIEVLENLNNMGVNLSIDDFGTDFSSLAYLKQLPVNELKIDKSFVLDMDTNENDKIIVQSTINLGHNLGLKVVAEGIERHRHLEIARQFGCDQVQGYLFCKPLNSDQFIKFLNGDLK